MTSSEEPKGGFELSMANDKQRGAERRIRAAHGERQAARSRKADSSCAWRTTSSEEPEGGFELSMANDRRKERQGNGND